MSTFWEMIKRRISLPTLEKFKDFCSWSFFENSYFVIFSMGFSWFSCSKFLTDEANLLTSENGQQMSLEDSVHVGPFCSVSGINKFVDKEEDRDNVLCSLFYSRIHPLNNTRIVYLYWSSRRGYRWIGSMWHDLPTLCVTSTLLHINYINRLLTIGHVTSINSEDVPTKLAKDLGYFRNSTAEAKPRWKKG